MSHTPGPWIVESVEHAAHQWIVAAPELGSIADCSPGNPDISADQATANARLIAAAPDLLEALQDLLDFAKPRFSDETQRIVADKAREAIAKAAT